MEINSAQVGQNFASLRSPETADLETNQTDKQQTEQTQVSRQAGDTETNAAVSVDQQQIAAAVSDISEFVNANNRQLNFSVDENSNKQVVKVTDASSGEVIRQIPSEEVLQLSERLKDLQTDVGNAVGLLFNRQV